MCCGGARFRAFLFRFSPPPTHTLAPGELRLRVLVLPIPATHRYNASYAWLTKPPAGLGGGDPSVKAVEPRDENEDDLATLTSFLAKSLVRARQANRREETSQQHRLNADDADDDELSSGDESGAGAVAGELSSGDESGNEVPSVGGQARAARTHGGRQPRQQPGQQPGQQLGQHVPPSTPPRGEAAATLAGGAPLAVRTRRRRLAQWRRGLLTLRVEERYG